MKNLIALTILIVMVAGIATATVATETVMAKKHKPGTSAVERGVHDAQDSCQHSDGCHWYILGKHKGFGDHSSEFNKNYLKGFCAADGGGSDADQATFSCP